MTFVAQIILKNRLFDDLAERVKWKVMIRSHSNNTLLAIKVILDFNLFND